jgi:hypothetical protein
MLNHFLSSRDRDEHGRNDAARCLDRWRNFIFDTIARDGAVDHSGAHARQLLDRLACHGFIRRTEPGLLTQDWPGLVRDIDSLWTRDLTREAARIRAEIESSCARLAREWSECFAGSTHSDHGDPGPDDALRRRLEEADRLALACVEFAIREESSSRASIDAGWLEGVFEHVDLVPYHANRLGSARSWLFSTRSTLSQHALRCSRWSRSDRLPSLSDKALGAASRWIVATSECFVPEQPARGESGHAVASDTIPMALRRWQASDHVANTQLVRALFATWKARHLRLHAAASTELDAWLQQSQVQWRSPSEARAVWIVSTERGASPSIEVRIFDRSGEISTAHDGATIRWNELIGRIERGRASFDRAALLGRLASLLGQSGTPGRDSDPSVASFVRLSEGFRRLIVDGEAFECTERDR